MKRIFIQAGNIAFPRGSAQANYIENLSKAIIVNGYEVILISGINQECIEDAKMSVYNGIVVEPIVQSTDEEKKQYQREHGFTEERMQALLDHNIKAEDIVITFEIGYNRYYHLALLQLKSQIGFKVIMPVVELYGREDFVSDEKYENFHYVVSEVTPQYDAVLSISENIDNYYVGKDIKIYRLPPMVDAESTEISKDRQMYRFLLITHKDSFGESIRAFAGLEREELQKIEVHICGVEQEDVCKYLSKDEWNHVREFVFIHDWLKYEQLEELYKRVHYLVIARKKCQRTLANFPSKVPECMSMGIVPIVSDVGDYTKYFLNDGVNSIFMDGDSQKVIRQAIRKAIGLSDQQYENYSRNAVSCVKKKFDYRVWSNKVQTMLKLQYNVLFVSSEASLGGASTSLIDMIRGLKNKNIRCVVIIPENGIIEERLQELDVSYYIVNFTRGCGVIGKAKQQDEDLNFYDNYTAAIQLQHIIKKENIDLVHINSSVSNVGAFAALMAGLPYVWHFREMLEEDFDCEFWDKPLKMELIHRSNCIISISKTVRDSYKRKYGIDSICIYDGVDAERYRGSVAWEKCEPHHFIITGVISPNKGQWDAVKAIETLVNRGISNIHLTLLGSGSGRTVWTINQYIRCNNLDSYITIIPFQKDLKKYREGNVYSITTSKMEALGRCTIEAMMAGNVVIGADTGGTFEIIGNDGTRGYLYKQGDYESLADVMYQAISDSVETKMKCLTIAQKYAEETFSVETYSNNILKIYQKVLAQGSDKESRADCKRFLASLEKRYQELSGTAHKVGVKKNSFSEIQRKWREL